MSDTWYCVRAANILVFMPNSERRNDKETHYERYFVRQTLKAAEFEPQDRMKQVVTRPPALSERPKNV